MNEEFALEPQETGDDWDDIDLSDLTDNDADTDFDTEPDVDGESGDNTPEETAEADQQTQENPEAEPAPDGETKSREQEDQLFTLKHLDETKQVTRDEVIALAQKGMDYDRIRAKYADYDSVRERAETAEAELSTLREHEDFLKEMADGRTVEEMIDDIRATALAGKLNIDHETALGRVRLDRERKQFEAEKDKATKQEQVEQQRKQAQQQQSDAKEQWKKDCFLEFAKQYPTVDPKSISGDVWAAFGNGETLVSAYSRIRLHELESKQAAQKQEEENAKRSTGSRQSAGKANRQDEFEALWYDGT